jgi:uncharacterized Fe-S cluster-containing radical SAM superfamily protein
MEGGKTERQLMTEPEKRQLDNSEETRQMNEQMMNAEKQRATDTNRTPQGNGGCIASRKIGHPIRDEISWILKRHERWKRKGKYPTRSRTSKLRAAEGNSYANLHGVGSLQFP